MAYLEKRGKNSWRLVVNAGYDANGKRIRRTKTVKGLTKREAEKELAKFQAEVEAGEYIAPEKMTFADFVEEWKEKYAKKHLGPKTYETYVLHLRNRIIPAMGHLRLDQIKPIHIINFLENLEEEGLRQDGKQGKLSQGTIEYYHKILRNVFKRAEEWKLIKESPAASVKKPKTAYKEAQVYDQKQVEALFEALEKEPLTWKVMITLAVTCGLRRGELLGLEWEHIDLEAGTIHIKQNLTYVSGQGFVIKEPKTKNSIRKVTVPQHVIKMLRKLKLQKMEERMKADDLWEGGERFFVFSSWNGKPINPSSVKTWWKRFTDRHNLPYIRFHDLRHTSATLLINQGVHMKTISARLGHANILTTMNIYGHALEEADRAAAEKFDTLFKTKKEQA